MTSQAYLTLRSYTCNAMRDKNALKLTWDRTLKGIFLQLAFVVVLNVFYLNFEKANREID